MSHGLPNRGGKRKKVTLPPPTPNSENGETEQDSTKTEMKEKPRKRKKGSSVTSADAQLDMTWICTECREAECITHPDSPLLLCEGECSRPFHFPCAGLASLPPSDEKWICTDCLKGQHQCTVCQTYGIDNHDVFCCSKAGCGLFFHESCLNIYNVDIQLLDVVVDSVHRQLRTNEPNTEPNSTRAKEKEQQESVVSTNTTTATTSHVVSRPHFTCPAHSCWTCTEETPPPPEETNSGLGKKTKGRRKKGKGKNKQSLSNAYASKTEPRLFRCLECPIAYHISCIPPVARFHELALLCHEHAESCKLPDLDVGSSFQGQVEAHADKKFERALKVNRKKVQGKIITLPDNDEPNLFFPGMTGDCITEDEKTLLRKLENNLQASDEITFCLPCDFKQEVHSKPPSYRQVHSLRYDPSNRPKRKPPSGESCKCKSTCDDNCLNRMVMMECIGDVSKSLGEKNPYWNCNCGPKCGNRALGQRNIIKCRPKREQGKGWGLIAVNGTKKGDLVLEYVGSVIDERRKTERLGTWSRDHPNDPNFYVMALDSGWYIDARDEANMSRFINHSCDPNCHLVRLNVNGHMRVGIFCIRDVAPGDFLCYDYQFDTKDGDKFICRCGAANCRGTMKGGKNGSLLDDAEKKTKKQVRTEAKARYDRDKKFLEESKKKDAQRLFHVGIMVPGADTKNGTETVAKGPQTRYRDVALSNRLFLWRNVSSGANFASRYTALQKRSHQSSSTPLSNNRDDVDILSILEKMK